MPSENTCCRHFQPIYFSREDTVETQEQVIDYLISLHAVCGDDLEE